MFGLTLRHVESGQTWHAVGDDLQACVHEAWKPALKWYAADPLGRGYAPLMDLAIAAGAAMKTGETHPVGRAYEVRVMIASPVIDLTPAGWAVIEGGAQQAWGE